MHGRINLATKILLGIGIALLTSVLGIIAGLATLQLSFPQAADDILFKFNMAFLAYWILIKSSIVILIAVPLYLIIDFVLKIFNKNTLGESGVKLGN